MTGVSLRDNDLTDRGASSTPVSCLLLLDEKELAFHVDFDVVGVENTM